MTLQQFWAHIDTMPDAALLAWLALLMFAWGAACGVVLIVRLIVARWPKRKLRTYRQVSRADLDRQGER